MCQTEGMEVTCPTENITVLQISAWHKEWWIYGTRNGIKFSKKIRSWRTENMLTYTYREKHKTNAQTELLKTQTQSDNMKSKHQ